MCKRLSGWIMTAFLVVLGCVAQAATRNKADNTNNLNQTSSWVGGAVPGTYDIAQWTNTVTGANAVLLGGNLSFMGIAVMNPGGAVAIGGGNTLTTGFMGFNLSLAAADLTLTNANLTLLDYASQVWNVTSGRALTVNPLTFIRSAGAALGVQGAGLVTSAAITNDATGLIGPWARFGTGTSAKYATVSGGAIGGYTGVAAATAANVTDTTGLLNYDVGAVGTLGAGASFNTLRFHTGGLGTIAGSYTANGLLNAGTNMLTLSGNVTIGASRELVVTSPDTTRRIDVTGTVGDNPGGASGITVTGGGQVRLTASNSYSGVSVVSAGSLYVNKPTALGTTNGNTVIYVNGSDSTGGQLLLSGSTTTAEPLTFVGLSDGDPWRAALAVNGGGGTNTLTGPITITAAGVRFTAGGAGTALNINGPIVRTSAGNTLILGANGAGGVVNVNYPINNGGGAVNLHNGGGTVVFNVAGNNIGDMNVQYQHLLKLGVSAALASAANLQVGGSGTQTGTAPQGSLDMAGFDQTVNGFYGDGAFASAPPSTRAVTNSALTLSTLSTGYGNGGGTFNGMFGGNLAYVKLGTGTETLCGPNFYTGGTTVNGGTLVLSNAVNHGSLAVNGGTFKFSPSLTVSGTLSGTGGTIDTLGAGSVLTVSQTTNTTFAGVLSNAGSLVKTGAGTLTLTGANTYSGGTTVSNGVLCFGKTASKPASGSVAVSAGAGLDLGVGGTGYFSATDVDSLWAGTMSGVTLDASSLIGIDTSAGDYTYAQSQSTLGLVKTGLNTLTLSGVNTFAGGTFVRAGVLSISTTDALPGWNTGGSFGVSRDAGLAVGNAVSDADFATIMGTGNFAGGACIGFDTTVSNRTYAGSISNTVNGALGVVKVGTNTLTLTADNAFDGITYLNGGKLIVRHSNALGSTNGYTVVNRAGGTASLYTDSTGQILLDGSAGALTVGESFIINGDQQYAYTGALRNSAGNNVINGWIMVGPIGSGRIGVDAGTLVLNGPIMRLNAAANPMLVLNPGAGFLIVSNTIDIGTGLLNCHSGGTVVMCSTNNAWGSVQIQYGGILRLGADEAMCVGKRVTLGNSEPGNGRLDLNGYSQTLGGLTEYGNAASKPNNIITNGRPSSVSTLTISQTAGTSDLFSGRITGAISLVKAGAANSVLTLAGTNTYSGSTTVIGGTLAVSNGVLGVSSTNVMVTAGTLALQSSTAIADTATLRLATGGGAKVNLASGVNESVRNLYLGADMQRVGTYGSSGSAATHKDDVYFLGTGVLTVLSDNSGTLLRLQ